MNKITRPAVGASYADEQMNLDPSRGRFIAPTADLSAPRAFSTIQIIV